MDRSKQGNKKVYKKAQERFTWDEAIKDAETQLKEAKDRVKLLKATLWVLKQRKETNAPIPGEQQSA